MSAATYYLAAQGTLAEFPPFRHRERIKALFASVAASAPDGATVALRDDQRLSGVRPGQSAE